MDYLLLTAHFFKATLKGQINSLWKKRGIPARIEEYKKALLNGHCKIDQPLNKGQVKRMTIMGIEVPEEFKPVKKPILKEKRVVDPNAVRLTNKQVKKLQSLGVEVPSEMLPLRSRK
jgi:hypothetical protein